MKKRQIYFHIIKLNKSAFKIVLVVYVSYTY